MTEKDNTKLIEYFCLIFECLIKIKKLTHEDIELNESLDNIAKGCLKFAKRMEKLGFE